ncbi:MAG: hypothetical protein KU38_05995 [Sulfurovum sp. FS08-3]|nr:MAG: hypothetical protein KU38_05995 [Sulfurovum sp. FS08-3]
MIKFLSALALASTLIWAEATTPPLSVAEVSNDESFEEIVLSSFQDNNSTIYIEGVAPSYEEFVHVRETMQGRKADPNRSKMRYYKKLDSINNNWKDVASRMSRYGINWDDVKFLGMTHEADEDTTDKLKKESSRFTYLNFSHKEQPFSIVIRSCVKFDDWKCGGTLRFSR